MLDVNIDAFVTALNEKIYDLTFIPFFVGEKKVLPITVKVDLPGTMELQVIGGGPVFLFPRQLSEAEAERAINAEVEPNPNYMLAAVKGQAAYRRVRKLDKQICVYADVASIGHIRIVGC